MLKKAGKKSGVRIVDVLDDDDEDVGFLDENLSLVSPLQGLLEDKSRDECKSMLGNTDTASTSDPILPVVIDTKIAME